MKLKELSVTIGRTINLGNYESLRVEATSVCSFDTENGDQIEDARNLLITECRASLNAARASQNKGA